MHPTGISGFILRPLQFIFAVLVLSLSAALVANQPTGGSPSQVNYAVFVGVFSLLTWFYTVAMSTISPDGLGSPILITILDALNSLFYFCGGIALATALRVHSCGNIAYVVTNKITAGSTRRCHEAQATTAFLWFGMFLCLLDYETKYGRVCDVFG
jgi:Membrane-associating domain